MPNKLKTSFSSDIPILRLGLSRGFVKHPWADEKVTAITMGLFIKEYNKKLPVGSND
jgi:hypothetical protein